MVAPINFRSKMTALIDREIEQQTDHGGGHLIFKMNSLVDKAIIRKLYEASRAGVKVDLLVRGICCLRPGIEGLSEKIRVLSIVGRFLEHSRIYYFHNGGKEEIYLGSADLMPRNIDRRVEVLFPVQDEKLIRTLREDILDTYLADRVKAREMLPDGSFHRLTSAGKAPAVDSQSRFLQSREKPRSR
jgi:polyphosphate kinase